MRITAHIIRRVKHCTLLLCNKIIGLIRHIQQPGILIRSKEITIPVPTAKQVMSRPVAVPNIRACRQFIWNYHADRDIVKIIFLHGVSQNRFHTLSQTVIFCLCPVILRFIAFVSGLGIELITDIRISGQTEQ